MAAERPINETHMTKLRSLENRLSGILKPVPPRKEFVRHLSHRIQEPGQANLVNHLANWHFIAMLAAGFLSAVVLLVVGIRALVTLAGRKRPMAGSN
jgi:hypothetical protein